MFCVHCVVRLEDTERKNKLAKQAQENCYHKFVENNLIIKQGFVDKRKVRLPLTNEMRVDVKAMEFVVAEN